MVTRGAGVSEVGAGVKVVAAAFFAIVRCPFSARSLSLLGSEHTKTPSLLTLCLTLSMVTSVLPLVVEKALGVEVALPEVDFFFLAARNFSRFFLIFSRSLALVHAGRRWLPPQLKHLCCGALPSAPFVQLLLDKIRDIPWSV